MKHMERMLLLAAAVLCGALACLLSCVFGPLQWPVFGVLCLFLGELFRRADRWIGARHKA